MVAAGTPADSVSRLEDGIIRTTAVPAVREKIAGASAYLSVVNSRDYGAEMRAEYDKWAKLINELNLKTD